MCSSIGKPVTTDVRSPPRTLPRWRSPAHAQLGCVSRRARRMAPCCSCARARRARTPPSRSRAWMSTRSAKRGLGVASAWAQPPHGSNSSARPLARARSLAGALCWYRPPSLRQPCSFRIPAPAAASCSAWLEVLIARSLSSVRPNRPFWQCIAPALATAYWAENPWGACSTTCGTGLKYRTVTCTVSSRPSLLQCSSRKRSRSVRCAL